MNRRSLKAGLILSLSLIGCVPALAIDVARDLYIHNSSKRERSKSTDSFITSNGSNWILYGPAIIRSSKSLVLYDREETLSLTVHDSNFFDVVDWLFERFSWKLNFSPKVRLKAIAAHHPRFITLYASDKAPTAPAAGSPQAVNEYEDALHYYLLKIPLNEELFGCSHSDFEKQFKELKQLIENNR